MRYLASAILYVAVYLGLGIALGAHPLARLLVANTLLMLLPIAVCVVIVRRRHEWEGTHRLFWDALAVGLALWCVGQVGFTANGLTGHRSWVEWHTMFSLCGGIGPMVALLALPHRGIRKAGVAAVGIEIVSYAMMLGFIDAYFVMVPSVLPVSGQRPPQAVLLSLIHLQRLILFVGLAAIVWFARHTGWRRTFERLAIGAGVGFVFRIVASGAITGNRYHEGSVYDLAWIVPYLCYLWAAREAPRSTPEPETLSRTSAWPSAIVSAIPVLAMPIIGFGLLRVQPLGEPGDSVRLLLTTLATVAGLGLLTLRVSMQSGELLRADARLRLLAAATEQTADLILITRSNGVFEHANDACVHALGYTRDELANMALVSLLERGFERMVDHIGSEVRQKGIWRGTLVHRRKNGTTFPASSTVVALRNRDGRVTHFVGVQRDITDELTLRDQLVHSERLSAVGELVAGVAHEINNPLQTIIGSIELMIEERREGADRRELEVVRREAARAGQIVRNLLTFVRRGSPERAVADLNQIARATAVLREQHLRDRNIRLLVELHPGVLSVLVNREEIQQVALNLVLNAEHAMGDMPGTITIRTNAREHAHTLQVMDDGPGIPPELRGRVFEPFFTTKDVGEGTGLGLSIALGIATSHGGNLEVIEAARSDPRNPVPPAGRGACFQLTLPAHTTVAPARRSGDASSGPAASARRRALVIEDEAGIRGLLVRLLARRDYDVTEAASCADARAAAERLTFDVVISDLRLSDGNGEACVRQLRAEAPAFGRRFIFISGDPGALSHAPQGLEDVAVLTKPFTASDLDRVLGTLEVEA